MKSFKREVIKNDRLWHKLDNILEMRMEYFNLCLLALLVIVFVLSSLLL